MSHDSTARHLVKDRSQKVKGSPSRGFSRYVVAYRNTAAGEDGTIALAAPEVAAAALLDKPARIGQETNYLGSDPVSV
ncbi:MAG: hypothetical protein ACYDC9_13905 [Dermatophilaceae bacterium]